MANICGLYKRYEIQGKGEVAQAVVETDVCGTVAEYHNKRDFGRSVVAAATVIF